MSPQETIISWMQSQLRVADAHRPDEELIVCITLDGLVGLKRAPWLNEVQGRWKDIVCKIPDAPPGITDDTERKFRLRKFFFTGQFVLNLPIYKEQP